MSGTTSSAIPDEGSIWVFRSEIFLAHHAHIKAGIDRRKGCVLCEQGLAQVLGLVSPVGSRGGETGSVVQSDRIHEEGSASPTSSSWWADGDEVDDSTSVAETLA